MIQHYRRRQNVCGWVCTDLSEQITYKSPGISTGKFLLNKSTESRLCHGCKDVIWLSHGIIQQNFRTVSFSCYVPQTFRRSSVCVCVWDRPHGHCFNGHVSNPLGTQKWASHTRSLQREHSHSINGLEKESCYLTRSRAPFVLAVRSHVLFFLF